MKDIEKKTERIKKDIEALISGETSENFWVTYYGATDIDPKHLVYWICVKSDTEKSRLAANKSLMEQLRGLLKAHEYPQEAAEHVAIGYESEETVQRESNGNWWHHWK